MKTTRTFLRDCTAVSPMALLLFGGTLAVQHEAGLVRGPTVDSTPVTESRFLTTPLDASLC